MKQEISQADEIVDVELDFTRIEFDVDFVLGRRRTEDRLLEATIIRELVERRFVLFLSTFEPIEANLVSVNPERPLVLQDKFRK